MKPFRFNLERLRKVRSAEERAAQALFSGALGALTRAEATLHNSITRREAAREELRHILASGSSVSSFLTAQRVTDRFDALVEAAEQDRLTAASAADQARAKWATTRAKDEGLSRLRAARKSEHRRESERSQARELDEIAMTRAAGNGNPAGQWSATTKHSS